MVLSNRVYDALKWVVLIFLPALAVLLAGLGDLYKIANMNTYVQTLNLFTVFMGTILQVSSMNYHNQNGSVA